jgi:hypothetical protein
MKRRRAWSPTRSSASCSTGSGASAFTRSPSSASTGWRCSPRPRQPVTIRQCYYHLDVSGLIAKAEVGYAIVVELMNQMLDAEIIDPDWVVDLSREPLIWRGHDSPAHAIRAAADGYYKNLWLDEPHYVQFWIEKHGLIETVRSPCMRRCNRCGPPGDTRAAHSCAAR